MKKILIIIMLSFFSVRGMEALMMEREKSNRVVLEEDNIKAGCIAGVATTGAGWATGWMTQGCWVPLAAKVGAGCVTASGFGIVLSSLCLGSLVGVGGCVYLAGGCPCQESDQERKTCEGDVFQ